MVCLSIENSYKSGAIYIYLMIAVKPAPFFARIQRFLTKTRILCPYRAHFLRPAKTSGSA